ncbi:MAG: hypothetical protein HWN67_13060 [Candidatus Helarchaeota archaeon]|nr:hypothetical protein [Candidatus Helarchaeota archaeon]
MGFLDKLKRDMKYKVRSKTGATTSRATRDREAKKLGRKFLKGLKKGLMSRKLKMKHIDNWEEIKEKFEKEADDPEKTVFFYLIGVLEYITGDKKQGEPMITLTVKANMMQKDPVSPSGLKLPQSGEGYFVQHMLESPNIVKSFVGGNPDNNYEVDKEELVMHLVGKKVKRNFAVIDIQSGGKDFYSRVKLQKNKYGIWKLYETSSIATGVQEVTEDKDDF